MIKPIPIGAPDYVFKCNILAIVRQEMQIGDKIKTFEWAMRAPGTRLIYHDKKNDKFLLMKEYRREHDSEDLRLPGGKVFDLLEDYITFLQDKGDLKVFSREAAINEGVQETGLKPQNIELYTISSNGTTMEWDLYYYTVTSYNQEQTQFELGEDITTAWYSADEIMNSIKSGDFHEDRSLAILVKYLLQQNLIKT